MRTEEWDRPVRRCLAVAIGVLLAAGSLALVRPDATAGPGDIGALAVPAQRGAGPVQPVPSGGLAPLESNPLVTSGGVRPGTPAKSPVASAAQAPARTSDVGVSAEQIQIGIGWLDLNALFAMANASMGTQADNEGGATTRDYAEAVVRYVNEHGGPAGRQIAPVYHEYPAAELFNGEARRRAEQAMCAEFTEDHAVFAMIPYVDTEGVTVECAVETDTPYIGVTAAGETVDEERAREILPWWHRPNWLIADRRERTLVERLVAQSFFGSDAKVGVMVADHPANRRAVDRALRPALAAAGVEEVALIAYPDRIESPWDSYVLQLRQAGVTHVIWAQDSSASTAPALLMRSAENQRWRARHAMASDTSPRNLLGLAPPEQLLGARGIGWSPYDDGRLVRGDAPPTDAAVLCLEILREAGYEPKPSASWLGAGAPEDVPRSVELG